MLRKQSEGRAAEDNWLPTPVATAVLHPGFPAKVRHSVQLAYDKYGRLTGLPDWSVFYSCMRSAEQQNAILNCDACGYLSGLPHFLQLMYRDFAEQSTGSAETSPELIRAFAGQLLGLDKSTCRESHDSDSWVGR